MESHKDMELVRQVLSYERDRVRYLLKSYLRARIQKIEQFAGRQPCNSNNSSSKACSLPVQELL